MNAWGLVIVSLGVVLVIVAVNSSGANLLQALKPTT